MTLNTTSGSFSETTTAGTHCDTKVASLLGFTSCKITTRALCHLLAPPRFLCVAESHGICCDATGRGNGLMVGFSRTDKCWKDCHSYLQPKDLIFSTALTCSLVGWQTAAQGPRATCETEKKFPRWEVEGWNSKVIGLIPVSMVFLGFLARPPTSSH